jgi:hypothetical protein
MKKTSSISKTTSRVILRFFIFVGGDALPALLKVDVTKGLTPADLPDRTAYFGDNMRPPIKAKAFCLILKEALDDFMLKVLIICAIFSITFDMILASEHDRGHGKLSISYPRSSAPVFVGRAPDRRIKLIIII